MIVSGRLVVLTALAMVAVEPGPTRNRSRLADVVVQSSDAVILLLVSVTLMLHDLDTVPVELTVPVKVEELASDAAAPARLTSMARRETPETRRILRRRVARLAILNRNPADSERLCKPAFPTPPPEAYDRGARRARATPWCAANRVHRHPAPSFVIVRTQFCNSTPTEVRVKAPPGRGRRRYTPV